MAASNAPYYLQMGYIGFLQMQKRIPQEYKKCRKTNCNAVYAIAVTFFQRKKMLVIRRNSRERNLNAINCFVSSRRLKNRLLIPREIIRFLLADKLYLTIHNKVSNINNLLMPSICLHSAGPAWEDSNNPVTPVHSAAFLSRILSTEGRSTKHLRHLLWQEESENPRLRSGNLPLPRGPANPPS